MTKFGTYSCILLIALWSSACSSGKDKATQPTVNNKASQSANLSTEHIARSLSVAICSRVTDCNQISADVSSDSCVSALLKDLVDALPEKARVISETTLDTCTAAIAKATCEEINSPVPPQGCSFME